MLGLESGYNSFPSLLSVASCHFELRGHLIVHYSNVDSGSLSGDYLHLWSHSNVTMYRNGPCQMKTAVLKCSVTAVTLYVLSSGICEVQVFWQRGDLLCGRAEGQAVRAGGGCEQNGKRLRAELWNV